MVSNDHMHNISTSTLKVEGKK